MQNQIKKGSRYSYTNNGGSAINPGDVVVLVNSNTATGFIGVSMGTIAASGGTGELLIGGPDENVITMTKKSGDVFTDALEIFWDATNHRLTTSSTGNVLAGRAYGPAATAAVLADLLINKH
jgi:hypothetical protein